MAAIILSAWPRRSPTRCGASRAGGACKVRVDPEHGVEVLLPAGAPLRAAAAAVAELAPWIERAARGARAACASGCAARARCPTSTSASRSCRSRGARARTAAAASCWCPAGDGARAVDRALVPARGAHRDRAAARRARAPRAARATRGLTIRNQRTRWASCASGGAMSFNWRLLLAPERVLDYVVWHEVCHLEVADHSPRFWALLERALPGWREPAGWLRGVRPGAGVVNHLRRGLAGPGRSRTVAAPMRRSVAGNRDRCADAPRWRRGARRRSPARAGSRARAGDLIVTFSGSGGGSYRFHEPAQGAGARLPQRRHDLHRDRLLPLELHVRRAAGGGSSGAAVGARRRRRSSAAERADAAAAPARPATTSTCTQALRPPPPASVGRSRLSRRQRRRLRRA